MRDFTKKEVQDKHGKEWITTFITQDRLTVADSLNADLIAKYLEGAAYIKSIKRVQRYTHLEIIVNYDNNSRAIYTNI